MTNYQFYLLCEGCVLLYVASWIAFLMINRRAAKLLKLGRLVDARVSEVNGSRLRYVFTPEDGEEVTGAPQRMPRPLRAGDPVKVAFLPGAPKVNRIAEILPRQLVASRSVLILMPVNLLMACGALYYIWLHRPH